MEKENQTQTQVGTDQQEQIETQPNTETTSQPQNGGETPENKIPYDRFKAKVDEVNALKEKLQAYEEEQERKRLAELSELEQAQEKARQLEEQLERTRQEALDAKKTALLVAKGYSEEQIAKYGKFVVGDDEDALKAAVDALAEDIPPQAAQTKPYADPAPGGGQRQVPEKTDLRNKGASAFQRLKQLGRI